MSLPETIWVKEERNNDGSKYLAADYKEQDLAELTWVIIGEYRLVKTRKRKLTLGDA